MMFVNAQEAARRKAAAPHSETPRPSFWCPALALVALLLVGAGCGGSTFILDQPTPTVTLSGTLVELDSGEPIPDAELLVGGTDVRARSDSSGVFMLTGLPVGRHQVAIITSADGTFSEFIAADESGTEVQLRLPVTQRDEEAGEAALAARLDALREEVDALREELRLVKANMLGSTQELKLFRELFVGVGAVPACRLLNAEVLDIQRTSRGARDVLRVVAREPLRIENRYLGYEVLLVLDEFELIDTRRGYTMRHEGVSFFEPLTPRGEDEKQWAEHRRDVYRGSLNHFLAAVAADQVRSEGYTVYSGSLTRETFSLGVGSQAETMDIETDPAIYMSSTEQPYERVLSLDGELRVEYLDRVDNAAAKFAGITQGYQTSWISSESGEIRFSVAGEVLNPQDLIVRGYWDVQPLCTRLPTNLGPLP